MSFTARAQHVDCSNLKAFKDTLKEWTFVSREAGESALRIFEFKNTIDYPKMEPYVQKGYCKGQALDFVLDATRRQSAIENCIFLRENALENASNSGQTKLVRMHKRDILFMKSELEREKVENYLNERDFRWDCKEKSYGREDKFGKIQETTEKG